MADLSKVSTDPHFKLFSEHVYSKPQGAYKEAAVMAILFPKNHEWHLIFMERTANHPEDKHAGQISFPGGQREKDETFLECAYRETEEEIGVVETSLNVIGPLSELYISVSNFMVYPFLAVAECAPKYILAKDEVAAILEIPLSRLLDPANAKTKDMAIKNRRLKNIPYYDLQAAHLWGATAMMTSQILQMVRMDLK